MNMTNSTSCIVQPFAHKTELYIASSISYGLGLLGCGFLIKNIMIEFSEANANKRTVFSLMKAWLEFLVSEKCIHI